jgi:hypothetical protein
MDRRGDATTLCCADCGIAGGVSLKACKACLSSIATPMSMNHWKKHKKARKRRAAELHYDAALFKDPPAFTLSGAARRGVVQGSPSEGGLSNLLPTNADKIAIVYLASIRHYINFAIAHEQLEDEATEILLYAAGKAFVEGVSTLTGSLGDLVHVHFVNQREWGKQLKIEIKKSCSKSRQMMPLQFICLWIVVTRD